MYFNFLIANMRTVGKSSGFGEFCDALVDSSVVVLGCYLDTNLLS